MASQPPPVSRTPEDEQEDEQEETKLQALAIAVQNIKHINASMLGIASKNVRNRMSVNKQLFGNIKSYLTICQNTIKPAFQKFEKIAKTVIQEVFDAYSTTQINELKGTVPWGILIVTLECGLYKIVLQDKDVIPKDEEYFGTTECLHTFSLSLSIGDTNENTNMSTSSVLPKFFLRHDGIPEVPREVRVTIKTQNFSSVETTKATFQRDTLNPLNPKPHLNSEQLKNLLKIQYFQRPIQRNGTPGDRPVIVQETIPKIVQGFISLMNVIDLARNNKGGKQHKRTLKYKQKNYTVRYDKEKRLKYIVSMKKVVYLKDIRGEYRYV